MSFVSNTLLADALNIDIEERYDTEYEEPKAVSGKARSGTSRARRRN